MIKRSDSARLPPCSPAGARHGELGSSLRLQGHYASSGRRLLPAGTSVNVGFSIPNPKEKASFRIFGLPEVKYIVHSLGRFPFSLMNLGSNP